LTAVIYSVTEAGFRMLNPIWIFFLLSVIEASWIAAGPAVVASRALVAFPNVAPQLPAGNTLAVGPTGGAIAGKIGR